MSDRRYLIHVRRSTHNWRYGIYRCHRSGARFVTGDVAANYLTAWLKASWTLTAIRCKETRHP